MTRAKLEQWLDKQIEVYNTVRSNQALLDESGEEYCWMLSSYTDGIHITHAKAIARFLDIPSEVIDLKDMEYPYKVRFTYHGVKFFTLYTEKEFEHE